MTQLDTKGLPHNAVRASTQAIVFDGGYGRPIKAVRVLDCVFAECGILRSTPNTYESHCGAILAYHATDITIKGCTIDGCVGRNTSYALSLIDITNALIDDLFITDIFSCGKAEGIFTHDVDGQVKNSLPTSIVSHVPAHRFEDMLDNHMNYKEDVEIDPTYRIEANHLKGVIPQHKEQIQALFDEHKWREFRTLGRLVCHQADKRSQTTAIYGKWVELFCERVLDVKVHVVGAFANLYENGSVQLPAHRDQYKKWIIGLSFGGTRTLEFVPDDPNAQSTSFLMESGDLFIFAPDVNNRYIHRMQEEPNSKERRINLTYFLDISPDQDPNKLLNPPKVHTETIPTFEEAVARYNLSDFRP